MTDNIIFIDTETTGLDTARHEVFEIALIDRADNDKEYLFTVRPERFQNADPGALRVNRFYERMQSRKMFDDSATVAQTVARLTSGKHVVGAVPDFDVRFLTAFLHRYGLVWAAHYHLVCVENLVAGKLGIRPPWHSTELSARLGVDRSAYDKHTAMGDARWARDLYDAVFSK